MRAQDCHNLMWIYFTCGVVSQKPLSALALFTGMYQSIESWYFVPWVWFLYCGPNKVGPTYKHPKELISINCGHSCSGTNFLRIAPTHGRQPYRWADKHVICFHCKMVTKETMFTVVCVNFWPERAIMSVCVSPWAANKEFSWLRLKVGWGSFPLTLAAVELSPSNLPNSTAYDGPPV